MPARGMANFGYNEMLQTFLEGRSAMYGLHRRVWGRAQLAAVPGGRQSGVCAYPRGTRMASQTGGLGLAIARTSERANAAFLLMQWPAKAQDKAVCALGAAPLRVSTLRDP